MTYYRPISGKGSRLCLLALTLCSGIPLLHAQGAQDAGNYGNGIGLIQRRPGLQLQSISVNSSYSLLPTPSLGLVTAPTTVPMAWDLRTGVAGSIDWLKPMEHGGFSLDYSGGYGRRVLYSDIWDSYNSAHLGYWYSKPITPRWNYALRLDSQVNDFETYFLSPAGASLSPAAAAAASAAANSQTGTSQQPTITDLANSGLIQNSPAQAALYGGRVLMTTLANSLSFAKSTRLSYNFGLTAVRTENLASSSTATPGQNLNSAPGLLQHGTFGNASVGVSYLVTPRTSMGASVSASRSFSAIGDYYYTEPQFHISHTLSPWWHADAFFGMGFTNAIRQAIPVAQTRRTTGGVSTTFSGSTQVVTLTASATGQDIYALGAGRTFAGMASWGLHPFGSRWSFFSNASAYSTGGSGGGSLNSWFASAGISRVLTDHLFLGMSGNYSNFQGQLLNNLAAATGTPLSSAFNNQAYRGVQMSITWAPGSLHY